MINLENKLIIKRSHRMTLRLEGLKNKYLHHKENPNNNFSGQSNGLHKLKVLT